MPASPSRVLGTAIFSLLFLALSCTKPKPAQTEPRASYVDARACRGCHTTIYDSYQQVGMARAFSPAVADETFQSARFDHPGSHRRYQVVQQGQKIIQRREELDSLGKPAYTYQLAATHVVGSGNHARTYLHRTAAGEFIELPLTWYLQEKRWALSPGFDNAAPADFTRIVDDRCLFCHNGYPRTNGELAHGIDCQRCHGPGSQHIAKAGRGGIVNPANLSPELQLDVCMQCHLETTSAELPAMVRRFDRDVHSFRPGEPLGDYVIHFDEAAGTGRPDKFEIAGQAYRLRQSACFLKSEGHLTCTTCHNPHSIPRGEAAVAQQRQVCRQCHATVATVRHPALDTANCASCHMPPRRTDDAVHVVMTDHLIQRRAPKGDLLAAKQEQPHRNATPAIFYPKNLASTDEDLYLGVALIANGKARAQGIGRLEQQSNRPAKAEAVLGEGYLAEGNIAKAMESFERALKQGGGINTRYNLGQAQEQAGQLSAAAESYRAALQSRLTFPEAEYALATVLTKSGEAAQAVEHYKRAIEQRPTYAEAHANLGALYADQQNLAGARAELDEALNIQPAFATAHSNMARVLAAEGNIVQALVHARRAVSLDRSDARAHYNLAQLLQHQNASTDAIAEYRAAIALKPEWVEPHLAMGQLFGDLGQISAAIAEFQNVLRRDPGHAEAQRNLNMALELKRQGQR